MTINIKIPEIKKSISWLDVTFILQDNGLILTENIMKLFKRNYLFGRTDSIHITFEDTVVIVNFI